MFTIFLGTMMTFQIGLPSMYFWLFSFASTAASMSAFAASAAKSIVKRALPLNEIVYLMVSSLRYSSLYSGHSASHTVVS